MFTKRDLLSFLKYLAMGLLLVTIFSFALWYYLRHQALQQTKYSLYQLQTRVKNDLSYKNNTWDTTRYNADPNTPHPQGSSGFSVPLYILTTEGFVIERNQPIPGYLDASDFKHLLAFQEPQTIAIVTNDRWQVLSVPVKSKTGSVIGVISTAYHNAQEQLLSDINQRLQETITLLEKNLTVSDETINIDTIDIRSVPYDIAFEIVNKYNKVLINNGRTPTFIDPNYVTEALRNNDVPYFLKDQRTNEEFLVLSQPLLSQQNKPIGLVIVGSSLAFINSLMNTLLRFSFIFGGFVVFIVSLMLVILNKRKRLLNDQKDWIHGAVPSNVSFDAKDSILHIEDTMITIPYATNQYYLCKSVFSAPKKRWEVDELLKKMGETDHKEKWRLVYDAALAINKKVGFKLIEYKERTFRLNPSLVN